MEQRAKIRIFILAFVVLGGLAFIQWRLATSHPEVVIAPETKSPEDPQKPPTVLSSPTPTPSKSVASPAVGDDLLIPIPELKIIRDCLHRDPGTSASASFLDGAHRLRLEDLLHGYESRPSDPEALTMNLHVRRPNGVQVRLHLEPAVPGEKLKPGQWRVGSSMVRVFEVDHENLPVIAPMPTELKLNKIEAIMDRFEQGGEVMFRERRFHQKLSESVAVDVAEENGRIHELQMFFGATSLGCAWHEGFKLNCSCM